MAFQSPASFALIFIAMFALQISASLGVPTCTSKDIVIQQTQVANGWKMVVSSNCNACKSAIVEVACPGWVAPKEIEGYMNPLELVDKDLCILNAPVSNHEPFSYTYQQPHGRISMAVAAVKYSC